MFNFRIKPGQAITLGGATLYCISTKGDQVKLSVEAAESLGEPTRTTGAIDTSSHDQAEQHHEELLSQDFMQSQW